MSSSPPHRAFGGGCARGGALGRGGVPRQPVPEQALLQERPGEHEHQQRQPQSGAQLRHGGHRLQGGVLPLLEVEEGQTSLIVLLLRFTHTHTHTDFRNSNIRACLVRCKRYV